VQFHRVTRGRYQVLPPKDIQNEPHSPRSFSLFLSPCRHSASSAAVMRSAVRGACCSWACGGQGAHLLPLQHPQVALGPRSGPAALHHVSAAPCQLPAINRSRPSWVVARNGPGCICAGSRMPRASKRACLSRVSPRPA
jgi:hypothetical protein